MKSENTDYESFFKVLFYIRRSFLALSRCLGDAALDRNLFTDSQWEKLQGISGELEKLYHELGSWNFREKFQMEFDFYKKLR